MSDTASKDKSHPPQATYQKLDYLQRTPEATVQDIAKVTRGEAADYGIRYDPSLKVIAIDLRKLPNPHSGRYERTNYVEKLVLNYRDIPDSTVVVYPTERIDYSVGSILRAVSRSGGYNWNAPQNLQKGSDEEIHDALIADFREIASRHSTPRQPSGPRYASEAERLEAARPYQDDFSSLSPDDFAALLFGHGEEETGRNR